MARNTQRRPEVARKPPFAQTVVGQVAIGLTIALGSALMAWLLKPAPALDFPHVSIAPSEIQVDAGHRVQFAASGLRTVRSALPALDWLVAGSPPNASPVAHCHDRGMVLDCAFVLPGSFAVSVTATDPSGLGASASATVTVRVPGGYLAVFAPQAEARAREALFYDVDWLRVQALVGRPVVIEHPQTLQPIYAVHATMPPDTPDPPPWRGAAAGLLVAVAGLSYRSQVEVGGALEAIGATLMAMPTSEIEGAMVAGAANVALYPIDSPDALTALADQFR